jgi:hypothetical protein
MPSGFLDFYKKIPVFTDRSIYRSGANDTHLRSYCHVIGEWRKESPLRHTTGKSEVVDRLLEYGQSHDHELAGRKLALLFP